MLKLGLGLGGQRYAAPVSGGGGFDLFDYDENTHYWDFETDQQNTARINDIGDDTLHTSPEVISGKSKLIQLTKDYQPLVGINGINLNKDTKRFLTFDDFSDITKGRNGYYVALNVKFDSGNGYILSVSRNASTSTSRGVFYLTGSRNIGFKAAQNDSAAVGWMGYTPQINYGQWYTIEMQLIADGVTTSPLTIWIDGVEQPLFAQNTNSFAPFPDTSPSKISVGNNSGAADSLDGEFQQLVFQNGLPVSSIQPSVSTFLQGVKP